MMGKPVSQIQYPGRGDESVSLRAVMIDGKYSAEAKQATFKLWKICPTPYCIMAKLNMREMIREMILH